VDPSYSVLPVVVPFHELAPTFISLIWYCENTVWGVGLQSSRTYWRSDSGLWKSYFWCKRFLVY